MSFKFAQLPSAGEASASWRALMPDLIESLESRTLLSADPVLQWNSKLLDAIRTRKTPPPYAARNMAMVHIAIFYAANAIDGGYEGYPNNHSVPKGASETEPTA